MRDYIFRFSQSIYLEKTSRRGFAALCIAIIIQSSLVWTVIVISVYSSITQTHLERFPAKASKSGFIEIISCFDYILPSPNKLGNTNHKDVNNASSSSSIWLLNAFVWVYNNPVHHIYFYVLYCCDRILISQWAIVFDDWWLQKMFPRFLEKNGIGIKLLIFHSKLETKAKTFSWVNIWEIQGKPEHTRR